MTARRRVVPGALGLLAAALVLTACGGQPTEPGAPVPEASTAPSSPAPTPEASATPLPDADPSCETIIPPATAADFADVGWTAQVEPFRIAGTEVPDGIECTWGDYSVATDHVQIFGWAPIEPVAATQFQDDLVAGGWRREDEDAGVYVTESSDTAIATDEDGYGITYLFGPGWVKIADTKQGLILVEWPPA